MQKLHSEERDNNSRNYQKCKKKIKKTLFRIQHTIWEDMYEIFSYTITERCCKTGMFIVVKDGTP